MHRRNGRYAKTSSALLNLGVVQQKSGHWASAAESFTQAHQVCLEVGDDLGLTRALIGLGNLARLERRFEEAERLLLAALEKARARALEREGALATEFLGELDFDRGVPESALARYDQALPVARRIAPDGDLVVELERRRGEALCALGRLDEAERACRDARRLAEHSEDRLEHAIAHRVAAALALRRGRREEAIEAWELSVRLLYDCHERFELGRTLLEMGRALEDPARARRCFFRAGSLLAELTTPYWFELAEAELKNALGPAPAAGGLRPAALLGRRHRAPSLVTCSRIRASPSPDRERTTRSSKPSPLHSAGRKAVKRSSAAVETTRLHRKRWTLGADVVIVAPGKGKEPRGIRAEFPSTDPSVK